MQTRVLLFGTGVAMIAAAGLLAAGRLGKSTPGELRAMQPAVEWRCADPSIARGSSPAGPEFEVVNVGGSPVRILSISTSCGCAKAEASPLLVPPGGRSTVAVTVDSSEVGVRVSTITLQTDAPATPSVELRVAVEGYRDPPYLVDATKALCFREGYSPGEPREFVVNAVALKSMPEAAPSVTSDLPFLEFGPPTFVDKQHVKGPEVVIRSYQYPVRFAAAPPDEGFSGRVSVADPWVEGRTIQSMVLGEPNRPIRVVPSRLVLDLAKNGPTRFLARSNRRDRSLTAVAEDPNGPLLVEEVEEVGESGFHAFNVRCKDARGDFGGAHRIIVRVGDGGGESLTVPVRIVGKGG